MKKAFVLMSALVLIVGAGGPALAEMTGYVDNAETNSGDWEAAVTALGGVVNTDLNFEYQAAGPLQTTSDSVPGGVTLAMVPNTSAVVNGQGPGQGNSWSPPVSEGEGVHAASNYLMVEGGTVSLTITFAAPVYGAGLFVIDYFDPWGIAPLTISAYAEDGSLLGSYSSVSFNFQTDKQYFMGLTSSDGDIASLVLTADTSATSDLLGVDDIRYAAAEPAQEEEITADSLLQFFNDSVADGTLYGSGSRKWLSKIRLWLTKKMIVSAVKATDRGQTRRAYRKLNSVYRRCDGQKRPKDFVEGEATAELAEMIKALQATLDYEPKSFHARFKRR